MHLPRDASGFLQQLERVQKWLRRAGSADVLNRPLQPRVAANHEADHRRSRIMQASSNATSGCGTARSRRMPIADIGAPAGSAPWRVASPDREFRNLPLAEDEGEPE